MTLENKSEETGMAEVSPMLEPQQGTGAHDARSPRGVDIWASLRRRLMAYMVLNLAIGVGFAILAWVTETWTILGPAAVELTTGIVFGGLYVFVRAGYPQRRGLSLDRMLLFSCAPISLLLPLVVLFASDVLIIYIPMVFLLAMIIAVWFVSRRRVIQGVLASVLGIALLLALNRLAVWPRAQLWTLLPIKMIAFALLGWGAIYLGWLLIRNVQVQTIRTRLLLAFSLVGVVPVILFGAAGATFGWVRGQTGASQQLDLSTAFVAAELESWMGQLQKEMDAAMTENESISYIRMLLQPRTSDTNPSSTFLTLRETVQRLLREYAEQTDLIDSIFVIEGTGRVVLTTDALFAGQEFVGSDFFQQGQSGFYVDLGFHLETGENVVIAAVPLYDLNGQVVGVLAARTNSQALYEILDKASGMQEQVETYLVGADEMPLTRLKFAGSDVIVRTDGSREGAVNKKTGVGRYTNYVGTPVIGAYRWVPELGAALLMEQPQAVLTKSLMPLFVGVSAIVVLVAGAAVAVALTISRSIAAPIASLAGAAVQIAARAEVSARGAEVSALGSIEQVQVGKAQELNTLANAFNSMTGQLHLVIGGLEERIHERTQDLERRSSYLEGAAEIGRTVSSILEPERLFRIVANMLRERFDLYYVGLFELEESGEWAMLRAGSAKASAVEEVGEGIPEQGYRVKLGEGLVGGAIAQGRTRVETHAGDGHDGEGRSSGVVRSEAALPLRSRGRVLGALVVSSAEVSAVSTQEEVFEQTFLVALQTMADQVAVALDNARLFRDNQAALAAARRASGELSREAWSEVLRARTALGFRCDERGVEQAHTLWRPEMEEAMQKGAAAQTPRSGSDEEGISLAVPIRIHDQVIGVLDTFKPASTGGWTREQVALVEQVAEQLSLALENARLYEETQRRGIREQQLREIGTRMSSTVDLDTILRIAVEDLAQALQVPSAFVQLYEGRVQAGE